MRLTDLLRGFESAPVPAGTGGIEITGLTSDSRRVEPGFLFAALPGNRADGWSFVDDAVRRGAAAVLALPGTHLDADPTSVALITDPTPRRLFALLAARFYGRQPRTIAAVTGTNGKTSTASFLAQIWRRLGRSAASLGTLGVKGPGIERSANLTTPDPVELHSTLARLADGGVQCVAMEASSHGLIQHRLDGVRIAAAAFTNLTRDHLEYHGSMDAYFDAKRRLFSDVMAPGGGAVLNADTPYFEALDATCRQRGHRVIAFGKAGRDIRLHGVEPVTDGQVLRLTVMGKDRTMQLPLIGTFQAANALAAFGLAIACGEDADETQAAIEQLEGVQGRMQLVGRHPSGAPIFVDYAHTPDALTSALAALRPHASGRLVVVFGCGGDRDPGKRPEMGHIAAQLADRVFVTDDNPRSEDPADIRREILAGCQGAREIGDRRQAIAAAVSELRQGDVLVVAGKGHERGQIVGPTIIPFDDAEAVGAALGEARP
ncbi:MAG: UDP-N-acetylmuramoyl-L-alanyl-D-glutamate--2,6-diaminopimelate ligase [Rhodospirillales bacterium]|nr:UDP-N-acetylmuramoyl-L-alanyl-D-glutamate--2,6-diaminopimelate ligase [Rhodospirillales bacterium]